MVGDWTDEQNDAIVADYFAMLADDVAARSYGNAERDRLLQAVVPQPRGATEYKHQEIGDGERSTSTLIVRPRVAIHLAAAGAGSPLPRPLSGGKVRFDGRPFGGC